MAKAINWAEEFLDETLNEDSESPKIALRVGTLYYDNGYYVKGEIVDIRVNHKIIRKAQIIEEMQVFKIKELPESLLSMNKGTLRQKDNIVNFLARNYNQSVTEETTVTVVTYRNLLPEHNEDVDDPHVD